MCRISVNTSVRKARWCCTSTICCVGRAELVASLISVLSVLSFFVGHLLGRGLISDSATTTAFSSQCKPPGSSVTPRNITTNPDISTKAQRISRPLPRKTHKLPPMGHARPCIGVPTSPPPIAHTCDYSAFTLARKWADVVREEC